MLTHLLDRLAATCASPPGFFGFPAWYRYLPGAQNDPVTGKCEITDFHIADIPLVGLALVDIALRAAGLIAVGYIIYGGIQFVIAQGEADKTKKARQTIINALVGLALAMVSAGIVSFIGTRIAG